MPESYGAVIRLNHLWRNFRLPPDGYGRYLDRNGLARILKPHKYENMKNTILPADIEAGVKKRAVKGAALAYLGITSMLVTFPYGFKLAAKVFPEWIAWLPAAAISILIWRFVDGDLSDSLAYREETTGKANTGASYRRRRTAKIAISFLLMATGSVTFVANYFVANAAIEQKDSSELVEAKNEINRQYSDKTDKLSAYLSEMEKDLSKAKKEGHKLVEAARYSSNPEWGKRFGPHLAYAETQKTKGKLSGAFAIWHNSVRQAQADSAATVRQAQADLSEAKHNLSAHLSVRQDSIGSSVETAFLSEVTRTEGMYNKFAFFLLLTDLVAAIVILFNHHWLCLFYKDNGTLPHPKASWQRHMDAWFSTKGDALKARIFPADLTIFEEAHIEDRTPPDQAPPAVVPVRAVGGSDNWEMERRQQLAEAKIAEMERKEEARARQTEERIRQAEARARQAEEEARRQLEAKAEADRQKAAAEAKARQAEADKKAAKALSDKQSSDLSRKLSAKITDKGVVVGGETYGVAELSKLKDKSQKWYNRQFTSSTATARQANKDRWDDIKPVWEKIGATLVYNGQKVSIEGGTLKANTY